MPAPRRHARTAAPQRGVALLEVLVALLIFMVGVLGLVGLETAMVRTQTETKMRADAAALANELIGRMWTDLDNLSAYNGAACASQTRCTEWQAKVAQALPAGNGSVVYDAVTGNVAVSIGWTLPGGESHRYQTHTTVAKASS